MEAPVSVTALGPIAQLGYVVDDVNAAMDHWIKALDVGPFFYLPSPPLNDLVYRGEPTSARIAVAITYSADLQVELIQPLDDHPSPYRDFQGAYGSGLHHIAHFTNEYDAAIAAYRARGRIPYYQGPGIHRRSAVLVLRLPVPRWNGERGRGNEWVRRVLRAHAGPERGLGRHRPDPDHRDLNPGSRPTPDRRTSEVQRARRGGPPRARRQARTPPHIALRPCAAWSTAPILRLGPAPLDRRER
jgi:Glyoxalase/Bleomycin resistance protein/Dioxygenase superfamily